MWGKYRRSCHHASITGDLERCLNGFHPPAFSCYTGLVETHNGNISKDALFSLEEPQYQTFMQQPVREKLIIQYALICVVINTYNK